MNAFSWILKFSNMASVEQNNSSSSKKETHKSFLLYTITAIIFNVWLLWLLLLVLSFVSFLLKIIIIFIIVILCYNYWYLPLLILMFSVILCVFFYFLYYCCQCCCSNTVLCTVMAIHLDKFKSKLIAYYLFIIAYYVTLLQVQDEARVNEVISIKVWEHLIIDFGNYVYL